MIYLDNNATTRTAPSVVEAMSPYWSEAYFNPTSLAAQVEGIRRPLVLATERLATLLNASPDEFTLTSGSTESNNWVLQSVAAERLRTTGTCHILISAIEHPSIIETAEELQTRDPRILVEHVPVDPSGVVELEALRQSIRPDTGLVSIMLANNETGVIQPVREASLIVKQATPTCLFHTDATQAVGKIIVDLQCLNKVDLLSLSAHKFHGAKGIGSLFIRHGTRFESWMHGGSQQGGRRAGTENPALAAGFAMAIELLGSKEEIATRAERICAMRNRLELELGRIHPGAIVLGRDVPRLANTSLLIFPGFEGEMLVHRLLGDGIIVSTGAACSNGSDSPSHVVLGMGVDYKIARDALRVSLSKFTTDEDITYVLNSLKRVY
jgi:cysteine desulfurase